LSKNVKKLWSEEWKENSTIEDSASPIGRWLRRQRIKIMKKMLSNIPNDLSVIDMGCGGGTTLSVIRESGFKDSVGIDFVESALNQCTKKGFVIDKDVFFMDAEKTIYPDRHFGLVFEEGLWEHFEDPEPFMKEACRICDEYMLIIQPDHTTFFGGLLHWGWMVIGSGGVVEYTFSMEYFIDYLKEKNFELIDKRTTMLNEQAVMLFRRVDN